jgi:DNA polymerase III subunit alpha
MFVHLHWHSQFSLLEAIGSSKKIISYLKELGFSHAPIIDYNGMYNVVTHYEICKKEGMTPILWADLAIQVLASGKAQVQSRFITLIAKNYDGYMTLLEIISKAQTSQWRNEPHLWVSYFPATNNNIIALISAFETPLGDMIQAGRHEAELLQFLTSYEEIFGKENVILEVIPQDPKDNAQLAKANHILWNLHEKNWLRIVATSNFHYIYEEDKEAYDIARCIKDGKRIYDDDRRKTYWDYYIMTEDDIRAKCIANGFTPAQTQEMIDNTSIVADMINVEIPLGKILFPIYESPDEIKSLYEEFSQK